MSEHQLNVLGTELQICGLDPITGYFRDGFCRTCSNDAGSHTVCAIVDVRFLKFSKSQGNDLMTPRPEFQFKGLKEGDPWCLCAARWDEARLAGCAPKVKLTATNAKALEVVSIVHLKQDQIDLS